MIYSVSGSISVKHPNYVVIETQGIGYQIFISLHSYSQLEGLQQVKMLTHLIIKEDGHHLFGFITEEERQLFILLISVNGVGPNTARLILSSLDPLGIKSAIHLKDDAVFRKIKGVGPKTAQRIIIDLFDKLGKDLIVGTSHPVQAGNQVKSEAISALLALGFNRNAIDQAFKLIPEATQSDIAIEVLIKLALKKLS